MRRKTRQQIGKEAQKQGMDFEGKIKETNDWIFNRSIGRVWHAHAAAKTTKGAFIWSARGPFDWFGVVDGRPVFFESKSVDFKQQSMPKRYTLPERNEHQLVALREAQQFSPDALCFVLMNWVLKDGDKVLEAEMRLHPIQTIPDRTLLRERGLLAPNRNWYQAAISYDYREFAQQAFVMYSDDMEIPV